MTISILTLFPEMFAGPFDHSIIKNAINKRLVKINYINIRDFGLGRHKIVDDKPYGGGKGMIMRVDVLEGAIRQAKKLYKREDTKNTRRLKQKVILLDPVGKTFDQKKAIKLSKASHLIFVCGHYEGIDARIKEFVDETISIGDFVVTGGEIPAMLITDSIIRLIKNVLPENVVSEESFSNKINGENYLEHPQYTRPKKYKNLIVPNVLLSGDHKAVSEWREGQAVEITKKSRPDLIKKLKRVSRRRIGNRSLKSW